MPLKEVGAGGLDVMVVSRPRQDADEWNNRGGQLVSSSDQRITVSAPRNAFTLATRVTLQVRKTTAVELPQWSE